MKYVRRQPIRFPGSSAARTEQGATAVRIGALLAALVVASTAVDAASRQEAGGAVVPAGVSPRAAYSNPVRRPGLEAGPSFDATPETFTDILARIDAARSELASSEMVRLLLHPGEYYLTGVPYREKACGNCEEPQTAVEATRGLLFRGISIVIMGKAPDSVVIHTGAGYGIVFEDCPAAELRQVTVTGGQRDTDPNATDAAVVVKNSSAILDDCTLRDNVGDAETVRSTVVGIAGVVGRSGSKLQIHRCRILRNSWDGIALYRGAQAVIADNVIDGMDAAAGQNIGGGRGVGIGVTWDARAEIHRNLVRNYWKGIGIFVDADATLRQNVVENVLTWGIALWDAGRGRPAARIHRNVVNGAGACGITITRSEAGEPRPGLCWRNVIARTGQNAGYDDPELYCAQCPLAVQSKPEDFRVGRNILFDNRRAPTAEGVAATGDTVCSGDDLSGEEFWSQVAEIVRSLEEPHSPALQASRTLAEWSKRIPAGGD
jgi:hypothetical protein